MSNGDTIMEDSDNENTLEIQRKRCTDEMYNSFPDPCLSCVLHAKHVDMGSCRFRNIRAFKRQPDTKQLVYGPYFTKTKNRSFNLKVPSTMILPTMTKEQRLYIQESIRPTMKELLERDWKVMKLNQQKLRRRPPSINSRHTCDHCYTNIFNVYYMCTICGVDVCLDCFDLALEWTIVNNNNNSSNNTCNSDSTENGLKYSLASCTLGRQHTKSQFIPIAKHTMTSIQQLRLHTSLHIPVFRTTSALILYSNPSPTSISSQSSTTSSVLSVTSLLSAETPVNELKATPTQQLPSTPLSPSPTISPPNGPYDCTLALCDDDNDNQLLVTSWKDLTLDGFQHYWRSGKPAIIQDTMERSKLQWAPTYFTRKYGGKLIDAIDCNTTEVKQMTIKDFFKRYQETDYQWPVLKIKDWPPGADFKTECPTLYNDFMTMVPVPEYCSATGVYNLSNRLPDLYIKPDLGPKMFIAYGLDPTDTTCQVGTTNLHCDMTDAVNVMCHAQTTPYHDNNNNNNKKYDIGISSTPGKAAAVWDMFSYDDLPRLRQFVGELLKEKTAQSPSASQKFSKLDPIHGQWIYLTDEHLKQLKSKYNVEAWRLYQNPGDAVFIPAGCAHQVANRCSAIKCAYDFVSPENIGRSAAITRQLGQAKQEDVLQLKTTLLYTWISVYKASRTQPPTLPMDKGSPSRMSPDTDASNNNNSNKIASKKRKREQEPENDKTPSKDGKHERPKKHTQTLMDVNNSKTTGKKRKHENEPDDHKTHSKDGNYKGPKKHGYTPMDEL